MKGTWDFAVALPVAWFRKSLLWWCCCTAFFLPLLKKTGIFIFKLGNPQKNQGKRMTAHTSKQFRMLQYLREILANWCAVAKLTTNTVFCCCYCFVCLLVFCKGKPDSQQPFNWRIQGNTENDKTSHPCNRPSTIHKVSQRQVWLVVIAWCLDCQHAVKSFHLF